MFWFYTCFALLAVSLFGLVWYDKQRTVVVSILCGCGDMKTIWNRIIGFLNIEPDPEIARAENFKTAKLILLIGLLGGLLRIALERILYGQPLYEAMIFCGVFGFLLIFCSVNWYDLKRFSTALVKMAILCILLAVAFFDYYPSVSVSAFLFLLLLVILPPMVFDKPWKLLAIVLAAGMIALVFNRMVLDEAVRTQNILRIILVTFLSSVFTGYFSFSRIRSLQMRQSTQVEAEHDPLTGLYNRGGGVMLIRRCVERHESGAFLIIDIDDFKMVNDQYGHQMGDEVLKEVSKILHSSFMKSDIVMRMGGDEFAVYAVGMVDYTVSCRRLDELSRAIRTIMISRKDGRYVTVSIGGAINDGSYPDYESLYTAADQYLYRTKARGKDGYSLLGTSYK